MKPRKTLKIGKCHPRTTRKNKCLPDSIYNITKCQGCGDHEIIDTLNISKYEKQQLRKYLRPRLPESWKKNPNTWLDNFNIENVMEQYEEMYNWFVFLGVFPIDFSIQDPYSYSQVPKCLYPETCNIHLSDYYAKGKRIIAMVFNLDPHYKGGSHWVALYIDFNNLNKPICGYFDSYGYKPPESIAQLMRSLKIENPYIKLMYNSKRFQYGHSECGMFSLFFIISMLSGISFRKFCKMKLNDNKMLELRNFLFSE